MINPSKSFSLSSSILDQLETEGDALVARIHHRYSWAPHNIQQHFLSREEPLPAASASVPADTPGNPYEEPSSSTFTSPSGAHSLIFPWPTPLAALLAAQRDAAIAARMQCALTHLAQHILPHLRRIDAHLHAQTQRAAAEASTYHLAVAYRAVKREVAEGVCQFGQCRDEMLVLLRDARMRATAMQAMQELFARVEEWYCRLQDLARFCPQPTPEHAPIQAQTHSAHTHATSSSVGAGTGVGGGIVQDDDIYKVTSSPTSSSSAHYLALLSPEKERTSTWLGVRVRQWREAGRHLVKLENIGDKRIRLAQALFSMCEHPSASSRLPTDSTNDGDSATGGGGGSGRWVDMMEVERVLTPVREREKNIGGPCEPAFICFAFAPCDGEERDEDVADEEGDLDSEEDGMRTPTKKRRDGEGMGSVSRRERETGMVSPPTSDGKRKRHPGVRTQRHAMSATFKLHVLD